MDFYLSHFWSGYSVKIYYYEAHLQVRLKLVMVVGSRDSASCVKYEKALCV